MRCVCQMDNPVYICMPVGDYFGWAVCGKYIVNELSALADVRYVEGPFKEVAEATRDKITAFHVNNVSHKKVEENNAIVLQTMNPDFTVSMPELRGKFNVGYTFFETEALDNIQIRNAKKLDMVIAGSSWCKKTLERCNIETEVIVQGIDPVVFSHRYAEKQYLRDKFVVYSGGKFEQRKGQDIVLGAMSAFMQEHEDVVLMAHWYNIFDEKFDEILEANIKNFNIPRERVIFVPPEPHYGMPHIFHNTDIGLFPNRIEGGTNLVLMEYMACGKPTIATYLTGHKDVIHSGNSVLMGDATVKEALTSLEFAYNNRDEVEAMGMVGAQDMKNNFTWQDTAWEFNECLKQLVS